eukprot:TRINITY_DN21865_c0_g1_i1.p1 TRINITY_DN21865_c0_g1~~TRINITY_DN21865_c0_g1_i1.p1  ORF type:complete len:545 (-),score=46.12 TRINITY_DN21865_c0_g1_i1:26-1660(-)
MSPLMATNAHDFRIAVGVLCVWVLALGSVSWCRLCENARQLRYILAAWVCARKNPNLIDDEVLALSKQRKLEWRKQGVQKLMAGVFWLCLVFTARVLQSISDGVTERIISPVQDYLLLFLTIYATVFPYILNFVEKRGRTADFLLCCDHFNMLLMHIMVAGAIPQILPLVSLALLPLRFFMAMLTLNVRLTAFHGLVNTAVYTCVLYSSSEKHWNTHEIQNQAIIAVVLVFADGITQRLKESEAVSITKANKILVASGRLLDLFCDCIMELSHDLQILSDARRFAAMLFLGKDNTMIGSRFTNYVDKDCLERLDQALHGVSGGEGGPPAGALSVRVRDSLGSWLAVEMFYIRFRGVDTKTRYLVGLREPNQDQERPASDEDALPCTRRQRATPEDGPISRNRIDAGGQTAPTDSRQPIVQKAAPEPFLAGKPLTTLQGKRALVNATLRSVNFLQHGRACCPHHEAMESFIGTLNALLQQPCDVNFSCYTSWQCDHCKVLASSRPVDNVCRCCSKIVDSGQQDAANWQSSTNATVFGADTPTTDL